MLAVRWLADAAASTQRWVRVQEGGRELERN
jgi:hypothetical protein